MSEGIDTVVTAETPEGIAIALRPAGIAVRIIAYLIDLGMRGALLAAIGSSLSMALNVATGPILILLFLVNWLYFVMFELTAAAATPGKRIMGLEVTMANGLPLTPAGTLVRNLLRAVDSLPAMYGIAVVSMLLRQDARRLGDIAGGTMVVYRRSAAAVGGFAEGLPLPPPNGLSAAQQAAIAAFAWRAARLTPERADEIAALAATAAQFRSADEPAGTSLTARLIGIARWQHGQRRPLTSPAP